MLETTSCEWRVDEAVEWTSRDGRRTSVAVSGELLVRTSWRRSAVGAAGGEGAEGQRRRDIPSGALLLASCHGQPTPSAALRPTLPGTVSSAMPCHYMRAPRRGTTPILDSHPRLPPSFPTRTRAGTPGTIDDSDGTLPTLPVLSPVLSRRLPASSAFFPPSSSTGAR